MRFLKDISVSLKNHSRLRLSRLSRRMSGRYVTGFLVSKNNFHFTVPISDLGVSRVLRWQGEYAKDEEELVLSLTNPESCIAVIGSHIGALAIPIAKRRRKVLCIEGNPESYEFLTRNIILNGIKNIESKNCFLGEDNSAIEFILNTANSGGTKRFPTVRKNMYFYDNPTVQTFMIQTFDEVSSGENYELVFMDVEGSEYFVLQGMKRSLPNIRFLVMEFVPHHLKNVSHISVAQLLDQIRPYFSYCFLPKKNKHLKMTDCYEEFEKFYLMNEEFSVVLFSKESTEHLFET